MKKKVYIAGPITGKPDYRQTFSEVAEKMKELGLEPVNPAEAPEGWRYKEYIDNGLRLLMECDMICMLPGSIMRWVNGRKVVEGSKGATLEHKYAVTVGMPVIIAYKDQEGEWQAEIRQCWDGMFK